MNTSSGGETATQPTTKKTKSDRSKKKTKSDKNQEPVYEMASDVTGSVQSLDKHGRLVSVRPDNSNSESDPDLLYVNGAVFTGGSPASPTQVLQEDSKARSPNYNQVEKKRAARTAQHGAGITAPGGNASGAGGNAGKGNGGVMEQDGAAYNANVSVPASGPPVSSSPSPASAATAAAGQAEQTNEPVFTSINDVTLIENDIYNR